MKDRLNITEAFKAVDAMTSVCSKGKAEIKELLATLVGEKCEPSREQMFPRVDCGRYYYTIDELDDVCKYQERGDAWNNIRYSSHNYFLTEEEAEEERQFTVARRKLQKMAHYLNNNDAGSKASQPWSLSWCGAPVTKYTIYYNHATKVYNVAPHHYHQAMEIYFKSRKLAEQALEMLTEDEKEILFRRGE